MKLKEYSWLLWIVLAGLAARAVAWGFFYSHIAALATDRLPDDALYYFTIARNLANGLGMTFDTVHSTNGMHPLWLFCITPVFLLGLTKWGAIHAILLFQSILDLLVIWFIGKTVYDALPKAIESNRRSAAAVAALLYALSPLVLIRSINGLETTLFSFLLVLWLRRFVKLNRAESRKTSIAVHPMLGWLILGVMTGFLLLARTDSFILLIPAAIFFLLYDRRRMYAGISVWIIATVVIVAPWILWNIIEFGSPLQSSARAVPIMAMKKYHVLYGTAFLKDLHLSLDALKNSLKPFWYSTFGLSFVTIAYRIFNRKRKIEPAELSIYLMLMGGMFILVVHTFTRGFIREWYVLGLIPLFLIGYAVSIGLNAGANAANKIGRFTLAGIVIATQCFWFTGRQYASQAAVVYSGLPLVQKLTRDSKVGALNSGYYSYFASRPGSVVDIDGVVSPGAVEYIRRGDLRAYFKNDSVDYFLDFNGDIGGYKALIDHNMLADFVLDTAIVCAAPDSLMLYRRSGLPHHNLGY